MFEYFGLVLVVLSWLGGYLLISRFYDKSLPTISKHAASDRTASWIFAAILILLGLAFYWWLIEWFMPHLELLFVFSLILTVTIVCQLIAAIAPDLNGWCGMVHRWAAWLMAVFYLPLGLLIILSPQLTLLVQVICSFLLVYMFIGFILVAVMGKAKIKIPATTSILHYLISVDNLSCGLYFITKRPPQRSFIHCTYAWRPFVDELRTHRP